MNPTDSETLRALFASWWAQFRGIFIKIAKAYATTPEDQADLEQHMLLQVWLSLPRFRAQSEPSTWIYRVCLNTALSWRRGEHRHQSRIQPLDTLPESSVAAAPTQPCDGERLTALYAAIHMLGPADKSLVLLSLDGLTYREMAEITGLTENHVGVALTRARAKLSEQLKGIRHELE